MFQVNASCKLRKFAQTKITLATRLIQGNTVQNALILKLWVDSNINKKEIEFIIMTKLCFKAANKLLCSFTLRNDFSRQKVQMVQFQSISKKELTKLLLSQLIGEIHQIITYHNVRSILEVQKPSFRFKFIVILTKTKMINL